jgi:hypothetical protein
VKFFKWFLVLQIYFLLPLSIGIRPEFFFFLFPTGKTNISASQIADNRVEIDQFDQLLLGKLLVYIALGGGPNIGGCPGGTSLTWNDETFEASVRAAPFSWSPLVLFCFTLSYCLRRRAITSSSLDEVYFLLPKPFVCFHSLTDVLFGIEDDVSTDSLHSAVTSLSVRDLFNT